MRIGRVRAAGHHRDRADGPGRQDHGIGAARAEILHHFLHRDDRPSGRQHRLFLHANDAFQQHVAGAVGAQGVDDRHVGADRRHGGEFFSRVRAGDAADIGVHLGQVHPDIAAEHRERQAGGARLVGVRHGGVGMLLIGERLRPGVFDGVAHAVQRADPRIAAPREHHLVDAAHADELVVDEVRRHADDGEMPPALADHLMAGRMGNVIRHRRRAHFIGYFSIRPTADLSISRSCRATKWLPLFPMSGRLVLNPTQKE